MYLCVLLSLMTRSSRSFPVIARFARILGSALGLIPTTLLSDKIY